MRARARPPPPLPLVDVSVGKKSNDVDDADDYLLSIGAEIPDGRRLMDGCLNALDKSTVSEKQRVHERGTEV